MKYIPVLNRTAVILKPNEQFFKWIEGMGVKMSREDYGSHHSIYLIAEIDGEDEFREEFNRYRNTIMADLLSTFGLADRMIDTDEESFYRLFTVEWHNIIADFKESELERQ